MWLLCPSELSIVAMNCASEEELAAYCGGNLDAGEREKLEVHMDCCDECTQAVTIAALSSFLTSESSESVHLPHSQLKLEAGAQVGRYVILQELGRGAMGIAYSAYDVELDRKIALKVVPKRRGIGAQGEARAMARLDSPYVVNVYDVITLGEISILAMELVEGESLRTWLKKSPPFDQRFELFLQAGKGLWAAHRAGVVHCDFKPDNVLVSEDGRARVADFGLARLNQDATQSGGTPAYMAPEHRKRGKATVLSDQYAYCVSFAEALTGVRSAASQDNRPEGISQGLWSLLQRGSAKEASERFTSMGTLLDKLSSELSPEESRIPLWKWGAGTALVASTAIAAVFLLMPEATAEIDCTQGAKTVAAVWPRPKRIVEAENTSARAISLRERVGRLDKAASAFAVDWAQAHQNACEATYVRREQSESLLDRKMVCLNQRLASFDGFLSALDESSDEQYQRNALSGFDQLPAISDCVREDLQTGTQLPEDPTKRDAIKGEMTRLYALTGAQSLKLAEGLGTLSEMQDRVEDLSYGPLSAQFHFRFGVFLDNSGQYKESIEQLQKASEFASSSHEDELFSRILSVRMGVSGYRMGEVATGRVWAKVAEMAIVRADSPPMVRGGFYHNRGMLLLRAGEYSKARESLLTSIHWLKKVQRDSSRMMMSPLSAIGTTYYKQKQYDQATSYHEQAFELGTKALGVGPWMATSINNLALVSWKAGRFDEAIEGFGQAHQILIDAVGSTSPAPAMIQVNIAQVYLDMDEVDAADKELELAMPALEKILGANHPMMAEVFETRATVFVKRANYERALELQTRAIELQSPLGATNTALLNAKTRLGRIHCMATNFSKASAIWQWFDDEVPRSSDGKSFRTEVALARAVCAQASSSPQDALRFAQEVLAANPDDAQKAEAAAIVEELSEASPSSNERDE